MESKPSNISPSVAEAALFLTFASLLVLTGGIAEIYGAVDLAHRNGQPVTDLVNARMSLLLALPVTFSLLGLVAAVGIFCSREWGRQTALFLATVPVAVYSLLVIFHPAFLASKERLGRATPFGVGDLGFAVCVYALVLFIPLSLWWLILLTRRGIRSQFR